jgi:hypothetical protein
MASARKKYKPQKGAPSEAHVFRAFIGDLLDGAITATRCHEQRAGNGKLIELEYDDPNGNGGGGGQGNRVLAPETGDPLDESPVTFRSAAVEPPPVPEAPKPAARARRRK